MTSRTIQKVSDALNADSVLAELSIGICSNLWPLNYPLILFDFIKPFDVLLVF